jgi:alanine-glyoxylate transaminase/serine-glyoxylate transaminase/serine-pyruvate transaminase
MSGDAMPIADLQLPVRLLAGGGPCTPDPRVLRALTTPLTGQFDPDFTAVMDDVVQLGRLTFCSESPHCFAVSALASGALEAVLSSLVGGTADTVVIAGSPAFAACTEEIARRCGAQTISGDALSAVVDLSSSRARYVVAPLIDPFTGARLPVEDLAKSAHATGAVLIVEATQGLAAAELRVDDWAIDVCVAGVDHAVGAPSGMTLITFQPEINQKLRQRATPPRTSYLDLVQLQAYWSPERLNHHTAPTSLVYALREALRLVHLEGFPNRWQRHARICDLLRDGLRALGLEPHGKAPFAFVELPPTIDEPTAWKRLLEDFGVHVTRLAPRTWRLGLLGAQARPDAVHQVLNSVARVLGR